LKGKLYAIGVGPGDPELITLKGFRLLKEVDVIVSTRSDQETESPALSIIRPLLESPEVRYMEFVFPIKGRCQIFMDLWLQAAEKMHSLIEEGKEIAFIVSDDPVVHSIFIYLLDIMEAEYGEIPLEIVPGINSFSAGASFIKIPLVMDNENLAVVPPTVTAEELKGILNNFDTVAIINISSKIQYILSILREQNLLESTYFIERCQENNKYNEVDLESLGEDKTADIIIVKT